MIKQNKAFQFLLYPNKKQEVSLAKTFGYDRFVYNKMLAECKETYEKYKDDKEMLKKQKFPTPAKYKDEFPFLKEVDSLALANVQTNLQSAYKNYHKSKELVSTYDAVIIERLDMKGMSQAPHFGNSVHDNG